LSDVRLVLPPGEHNVVLDSAHWFHGLKNGVTRKTGST